MPRTWFLLLGLGLIGLLVGTVIFPVLSIGLPPAIPAIMALLGLTVASIVGEARAPAATLEGLTDD